MSYAPQHLEYEMKKEESSVERRTTNCNFINLFMFLSSPEEKIKALEKKVNELIEESCFANSRGEYQLVKLILFLRYSCEFK